MKNIVKIIGFDADDTLWVNEHNFRETEKLFCSIVEPYLNEQDATKELFKTEMQNLEMYGFGVKGFMLSMIETAIRVSENRITTAEISHIIEIGRNLLNKPIILLENVEMVLQRLQPHYKLILATKGDLLDQEQKLLKSGLSGYFHHIEIMSDKKEHNYQKLIQRLEVDPKDFVMVGNSINSDILPVINIGSRAIHVPYEITWLHEQHHNEIDDTQFTTVSNIIQILDIL